MTILSYDFIYCCGIRIIAKFPEKKCDLESPSIIGVYSRDFRKKSRDVEKYCGLNLVSLSEPQIPYFGGLLKECGYMTLSEFVNPNSNNIVRLYGRENGHKKRVVENKVW